MSDLKIIVTRRWPETVENELKAMCSDVTLNEKDEPMTRAELQKALQEADCVLPTVTDPINAEVLGVSDMKCRFLGNFGVGFNHIDLDAAKKANLVVSNTPEVLTDCTADIAMTLMLSVARRAGEGERHLRSKSWIGWRPTHMVGSKVSGKTLGIIGYGRIAKAVSQRAHCGFGMKIVYFDPSKPAPAEGVTAECMDTIEDVLKVSDYVSLHCPGGDATRHLINAERLKLMKNGAFLINTARGDIVDSGALINALKNGDIAGAGLDVYEGEPNLDPGFLDLENAVLLPHLGSASKETRIAMGRRVLTNLEAWMAGKEPPDRVA